MEAGKIESAIATRYREGKRTTGSAFEAFCINHRITHGEYFKIETEMAKRESISLERQSRWIADEKLTPLEYRLYVGIPISIFYGYVLQCKSKKPKEKEKMYPCGCLKRKGAGRYLRHYHKLNNPMEGWYARVHCGDCKGTGITFSSLPSRYAWRLQKCTAKKLLDLEKKTKVA